MVLVFFGRWYNLYEEGIGELTFSRFLKYAYGIMTFESSEWDKSSPPPFSKQEDARKFYQNIKEKLDATWNSMFPPSEKHGEDMKEAALVFKAKQEKRKAKNG